MNSHASRIGTRGLAVTAAMLVGLAITLGGAGIAGAAVVPTVGLGTAASFGVLGGSTVTNTGTSTINGLNVGVSPGSAVTGFPPGVITPPGGLHKADAVAGDAQSAALTAFNDAAGRSAAPADKGLTDLVGKTLQPGVYQGNLSLTGTVTLDNRTNPDAVFIFQASSTLITGSGSAVAFTTPHASCNVFWQVGTSATLGTGTRFVGTVLAHVSVTAQTGATVTGRLLAATGAVTLDTNVITAPSCAAPPPTTTPPTTTPPPPPPTTSTGTTSSKPTPPSTPPSGPPTGPTTGPGSGTATSNSRTSTSPPNENTTPSTISLLPTTPTATGPSTNTTTPRRTTTTTGTTVPSTNTTTPRETTTGTNTTVPSMNTTTPRGTTTGTNTTVPSMNTTTPQNTTTSSSAAAVVTTSTSLTQPSFPGGVPSGVGPAAPASPLAVIGAILVLLGSLLLLWRIPATRRLLNRIGTAFAATRNGSGEHR